MRDIDFILQTMRVISATALTSAQKDAILSASAAAVSASGDLDLDNAFRRQVIVRQTMLAFGRDLGGWEDVFSAVWIACRNADKGWGATAAEAAAVERRVA